MPRSLRPCVLLPLGSLVALGLAPIGAQCPVGQLVPHDGVQNARFGHAVALDGDCVVVGAYADPGVGIAVGAAYVYEETASGLVFEQKLGPSDPDNGDGFGRGVAIAGDTLIVGAGDQDIGTSFGQGSAYVFERGPSGWSQTQKLVASNGAELDRFGSAVAMTSGRAIVGAYAAGDSGRAWIFEEGFAGFQQMATLDFSSLSDNARFGWSVAIEGDVAVVGAPFDESGWLGSAYVFERNALFGIWLQTGILQPPSLESGARFGWSVDVSNGIVVVGATGDPFEDEGAVHVFRKFSNGWQEMAVLSSPEPIAGGGFGRSVSLEEGRLLVGQDAVNAAGGPQLGSAFVFEADNTIFANSWTHTHTLEAMDEAAGDGFARACALAGDRAMVGATFDDDRGNDSGSAWLFSTLGDDCPPLVAAPPYARIATGGEQAMRLDAGLAHAGDLFLILGSSSGTSPGTAAIPPPLTWPLNLDGYFLHLLSNPNSLPFDVSLGTLDGQGRADVTFTVVTGLSPSLAGLVLHHAFGVLEVGAVLELPFMSNPVAIELIP